MIVNVSSRPCTRGCDNVGDAVRAVTVSATSSIMEGEIAKARLEGEGIPVLLKGGGLDPYTTRWPTRSCPWGFEAQARLLLEDVVDDQPDG